jgi:hypothetical protein
MISVLARIAILFTTFAVDTSSAVESTWEQHWSEVHQRSYFWCASSGTSHWDSRSEPCPLLTFLPGSSSEIHNDCSSVASALFENNGAGLRRSWRSLALQYHPDKTHAQSDEKFYDVSSAKDSLSSPLRFLAYRALHSHETPMNPHQPTDNDAPISILSADTSILMKDNWPYLVLDLELFAHSPVDGNSSYQIALSAEGVSTIEYKGDDSVYHLGGYSICDNFVQNSTKYECQSGGLTSHNETVDESKSESHEFATDHDDCRDLFDPKAVASVPSLDSGASFEDLNADLPTIQDSNDLRECKDFVQSGFCDKEWYRVNCMRSCGLCSEKREAVGEAASHSDPPPMPVSSTGSPSPTPTAVSACPLSGPFTARVSKPLHLKRAGTWSAVVTLASGGVTNATPKSPSSVACAALIFNVSFPREPPGDDNEEMSTPDLSEEDGVPGDSGDSGECSGESHERSSSGSPKKIRSQPRFERYSTGKVCSDGADLLEGPLDKYTDCDEITKLCKKTRKCSEKCKRNKSCLFFTTFQNGWCQLSSRCSEEALSSDKSAQTFARVS